MAWHNSSIQVGAETWKSELGTASSAIPATANEFEMQVRQLGLSKATYADSKELRGWCERNRNRCYVPEWLLDVCRNQVNPNFGW